MHVLGLQIFYNLISFYTTSISISLGEFHPSFTTETESFLIFSFTADTFIYECGLHIVQCSDVWLIVFQFWLRGGHMSTAEPGSETLRKGGEIKIMHLLVCWLKKLMQVLISGRCLPERKLTDFSQFRRKGDPLRLPPLSEINDTQSKRNGIQTVAVTTKTSTITTSSVIKTSKLKNKWSQSNDMVEYGKNSIFLKWDDEIVMERVGQISPL